MLQRNKVCFRRFGLHSSTESFHIGFLLELRIQKKGLFVLFIYRKHEIRQGFKVVTGEVIMMWDDNLGTDRMNQLCKI